MLFNAVQCCSMLVQCWFNAGSMLVQCCSQEPLMHHTDGFGAEESGYIDPDDDSLKVHFKGQLWHMSELTMDERKFVKFRAKR
jgi:hypothetical protein